MASTLRIKEMLTKSLHNSHLDKGGKWWLIQRYLFRRKTINTKALMLVAVKWTDRTSRKIDAIEPVDAKKKFLVKTKPKLGWIHAKQLDAEKSAWGSIYCKWRGWKLSIILGLEGVMTFFILCAHMTYTFSFLFSPSIILALSILGNARWSHFERSMLYKSFHSWLIVDMIQQILSSPRSLLFFWVNVRFSCA